MVNVDRCVFGPCRERDHGLACHDAQYTHCYVLRYRVSCVPRLRVRASQKASSVFPPVVLVVRQERDRAKRQTGMHRSTTKTLAAFEPAAAGTVAVVVRFCGQVAPRGKARVRHYEVQLVNAARESSFGLFPIIRQRRLATIVQERERTVSWRSSFSSSANNQTTMDVFLLAVIVSLLCLLVRYCVVPLARRTREYWALRAIPYPEPPHWLLGHLPALTVPGTDEERYERWLKDGKRIMQLNVIAMPEVVLVHPDTAAVVLKTAEPKGELAYGLTRLWLGQGLLVSTGKRWARDRRLLTRGFHFDILRGYLPVYKEAVSVMLEKWAEIGRHGDGQQAVNVTKSANLLTLDVILRCIMSFESNCQAPEDADKDVVSYAHAVLGLTSCIIKRYYNPLQHSDFLFALSSNGRKFYRYKKTSDDVSQNIIAQRRKVLADVGNMTSEEAEQFVRKKTRRRYLDFLDILLTVRDEDGNGLSDAEIQEQVDTFLFEGHDTTASALQWTMYYLAAHPELQERCRQEVKRSLDESGELSYESLSQLLYLTQFIKESMRLGSPVPFITRSLTQPTTIDGHVIPAGVQVTLAIFAIHRHPDAWERALEFDPERFSPENSENRHPYAFVPFSAGPRNCIGQALAMDELKTVISLTLLRFRLTVANGYVKPRLQSQVVSRPLGKIEIFAHEI